MSHEYVMALGSYSERLATRKKIARAGVAGRHAATESEGWLPLYSG
jgi:hypothetical protein